MITGSLSYLRDKKHIYNTDFALLPKSRREPRFVITPVNAFEQFTWISELYVDTDNVAHIRLKNITQSSNVIGMVEGTHFQIKLKAFDMSNLYNIANDNGITYRWKKDGASLYEYNSQNNLFGTSIITITSESCTRDISGTYELEATNKYGTTVSDQVVIDVVNTNNHPYLHKNLLANGCGELGLGNWTTDSDVTVKGFSGNRNQSSIPSDVYNITYRSPYYKDFTFTLYGNETKLSVWFDAVKNKSQFQDGAPGDPSYKRWIIGNFLPNLVPTDGGSSQGRPQDSFFPSWDYIDGYNKNDKLYKLGTIITNNKTYITREKIKFTSYGGRAKSIAYQDIGISEAAGVVDGEYYGIDRLVAHFFAYVGIGISTYKMEFVDASTGKPTVDNMIPVSAYNYKVGSVNGKPSFIPLHPKAGTYDNPYAVTTYRPSERDKYSRKIKAGTKIQLTPVCYDLTDIRLDFLNLNGEVIRSEIIEGPREKDIWAVKEKFFMPMHIGNLYGWTTNAKDQEFCFYSQSFTTMNAILGVTYTSSMATKDTHAEYIKEYYYDYIASDKWAHQAPNSPIKTITLSKDEENQNFKQAIIDVYGFNKSFVEQHGPTKMSEWYIDGNVVPRYDGGAAAFFGIQSDMVVPKGTRTIRVNIIFNHTSETIYDDNPRAKNWNSQTIYYDVFTKGEVNEQLVDYNRPRCGVTAMHLSLHPNIVQISEDYNTYIVEKSGSVWQRELERLNNPVEYWSVAPQSHNVNNTVYTYSVSSTPPPQLNTDIVPMNVVDLPTLIGATNPYVFETGSGVTVLDPPTGSLLIEQSDDTGSLFQADATVTASADGSSNE